MNPGYIKAASDPVPGELLGPQAELIDLSGGYEKNCGEEGHAFFRAQKAIDISISGGVGEGFGISASAGIKGFIGLEAEFKDREVNTYLYYGYSASGSVSVHLALASYTKPWYWEGDKDRKLVSKGTF